MAKISRNTKQKELLKTKIKGFISFFTAEDLLKKASSEDSKIGIATVYRFLRDSTNKGRTHSYTCNRRTIYSINKTNHVHFKCKKCRKISHLNIKDVSFLKEITDCNICHFQIELTGTCSKC